MLACHNQKGVWRGFLILTLENEIIEKSKEHENHLNHHIGVAGYPTILFM